MPYTCLTGGMVLIVRVPTRPQIRAALGAMVRPLPRPCHHGCGACSHAMGNRPPWCRAEPASPLHHGAPLLIACAAWRWGLAGCPEGRFGATAYHCSSVDVDGAFGAPAMAYTIEFDSGESREGAPALTMRCWCHVLTRASACGQVWLAAGRRFDLDEVGTV